MGEKGFALFQKKNNIYEIVWLGLAEKVSILGLRALEHANMWSVIASKQNGIIKYTLTPKDDHARHCHATTSTKQ